MVSASKPYASAVPVRISRSGVSPCVAERATAYTIAIATSAEQNADTDSAHTPSPANAPSRMTALAPTAAPDEIPSTNGSASALRTIACTATPTVASPAPTTAASTTRGSRISQTIVYDATSAE